MKAYLELEGMLGPKTQLQPNQFRPPQPNTNPQVRKESKTTEKRKRADSHQEIQGKGSGQGLILTMQPCNHPKPMLRSQ